MGKNVVSQLEVALEVSLGAPRLEQDWESEAKGERRWRRTKKLHSATKEAERAL
jgi:hypothetical protein